MKTAEEWALEFLSTETQIDKFEGILKPEFIKQIQLDAYKAGMTEAAEICERTLVELGDHTAPLQGVSPDSKTMVKSILTARDSKTEWKDDLDSKTKI